MDIVVPQCNAYRQWKSCSQLQMQFKVGQKSTRNNINSWENVIFSVVEIVYGLLRIAFSFLYLPTFSPKGSFLFISVCVHRFVFIFPFFSVFDQSLDNKCFFLACVRISSWGIVVLRLQTCLFVLFPSGFCALLWMSKWSFLCDQHQPSCRQRGIPVCVSWWI